MTQRGKKLRGNGLWESSRIILPQHKEAIRMHRKQLNQRVKPELDEQRLEELSLALQEAFKSGKETVVTTFNLYEDEKTVGIIEKIDPLQRRIKVRANDEIVWIPFDQILKVEEG